MLLVTAEPSVDEAIGASPRATVILVGVADATTGLPLVAAQVRIQKLGRVALTDSLGEARLTDVPAGLHQVEARQIGYARGSVPLAVKRGVDTMGIVFMLEPIPEVLDTVRVIESHVPLRLQEFEGRRRLGIGRFLTDSMLFREKDGSLALALSIHLPGLRAVADASRPGRWGLSSTRGSGALRTANSCLVDVYLDGFPLADDIDAIAPAQLAGVELYSYGAAPPQYRRTRSGSSSSCHVLLLWSRP